MEDLRDDIGRLNEALEAVNVLTTYCRRQKQNGKCNEHGCHFYVGETPNSYQGCVLNQYTVNDWRDQVK